MKKAMSLLFALLMVLGTMGTAMAGGPYSQDELCGEPVEIYSADTQVTSDCVVYFFKFSIPADGKFHKLEGFTGDYKESHVEVIGTWEPFWAGMTVEIDDDFSGGGSGSYLSKSGDSAVLSIFSDSQWSMYLMAEDVALRGAFQVKIYTDILPVPDASLFGCEGETEIISGETSTCYNENGEQNQVFLPDELGASDERQAVVEAAEQYLSDWAYKSYMYWDKDLTIGTVLDANVEEAELAIAVSKIAASNDVGQSIYHEIVGDQVSSINAAVVEMQANMQFMVDKATYFSEIRQYSGLQRTNFDLDYVIQNVDIQGNIATVDVLEGISFQYVDVEAPSFIQEEHTVSLIEVDGEWIVANVETKYDWFASEYKNTSYEINSIIASEIENIDGMYSWTVLDAKTTTVETAETDPVTGMSRVVFERTFEGVKASVSRESYIVCDITVTMIENTNNTSGFEMTGVKSVAITDFSGWHGARSAKVSNTTYGDDRQKVVVEIAFSSQLEVGAPWLTQTASTTLSIL